ncbi:DUF3102 domain-containing protein [Clostridium perfringens]|uniref:DUF3102 domain-containing protein n=2 Tax=Clostridium perfringens TaxID=1502 RepID=UPI0018D9DD55|nr:DUF3102 domain-containing protein [Clostridium perfringens]MCR1963970.1 DUF3102 domain-containing protein [Clostridium perfringens]MDK0548245.1 DUF3102 domain-containing protein [Clostridium perfringens]MDK0646957.1 DUF3102 domain-containing protein [Clostridium perfringens]MDK0754823.1 DUF3102 domain-containing protein [Clostridium perfringens]MDK0758022.1 DUF3102 domain-containing protein [Clostridium perfringens]
MMNELEQEQIAKRDLKTIEDEILFYKNNMAESIIEIGKRLIEVQSRLEDKTFRQWLKEKVDFSKTTAYDFIRVAKEFTEEKVKTFGQSKSFELTKIDKQDREDFINNTHLINGKEKTVKEMSVRELKKVIKEEFNKDKPTNISKSKETKDVKSNLDNSFYQKSDYTYEDFLSREKAIQEEIERLQREKERIVYRKLNEAKNIEDIKIEFEEEVDDDELNFYKQYCILIYIYRNKEREYLDKISCHRVWSTTKEKARENLQCYLKKVPWSLENKVTQKEWDKIKVKLLDYWENTYWVNVENRERAEREEQQRQQQEEWNRILEEVKSNITPEKAKLKRELINTGFKKLAMQYHPDKNPDGEENFKLLLEIKEELLKNC